METLRTSYYCVGLIREPDYSFYDSPYERWKNELNNHDFGELFSSRSRAAEAPFSLAELRIQREGRFSRWLDFVSGCNNKSKLTKAVSLLNQRYHAYRRLCEKHGDWRWVYLTASQYRVLRTLIWRKI